MRKNFFGLKRQVFFITRLFFDVAVAAAAATTFCIVFVQVCASYLIFYNSIYTLTRFKSKRMPCNTIRLTKLS